MKIQSGQTKNFIDAFLYYGINEGKVDTQGLEFAVEQFDIQTLNDHASRGDYEVSSISAHCYTLVSDKYNLSTSGAFFSAACIISRDQIEADKLSELKVAAGGTTTSAYLAGLLYCPEMRLMVLPADKLISAVSAGIVDCAVLSCHDLLEVPLQGLCQVVDLGDWFSQENPGLQLPLTVAAVRNDLPGDVQQKIQSVIESSVQYALNNRAEAIDYAMQFDDDHKRLRVGEFLNKYVTDSSVNIKTAAGESVEKFLAQAAEKGLIAKTDINWVK